MKKTAQPRRKPTKQAKQTKQTKFKIPAPRMGGKVSLQGRPPRNTARTPKRLQVQAQQQAKQKPATKQQKPKGPAQVSQKTAQMWANKLQQDQQQPDKSTVQPVEQQDGFAVLDAVELAKLQFAEPDEKIIRHVIKQVTDGNRPDVAFATLGIAPTTVRKWCLIGATDPASQCGLMLRALMIAEARSECEDVRTIRQGGQAWTAKAWLRARTAPSRWGDRTTVEVSSFMEEVQQPVKEATPASIQDASAILQILEAAGALQSGSLTVDVKAEVVDDAQVKEVA